eukprot:c17462_g1_i1 orf=282-2039(+)
MRTGYVLYKEASWQHRCLGTIRTEKPFTKLFLISHFAKQSGSLKTNGGQGQAKRVCLKRRRRSCCTLWRWSACSNGQPTSKESTSPVSKDENAVRGRNMFWDFLDGARNVFKADDLGVEISAIALPALLALAADPLASLVDTAFIGRLGSVELAAVGVSIAVFNLVSKLLNFPVLNLTTSFVAEEAIDSGNASELELEAKFDDSRDAEDQSLLKPVGTKKERAREGIDGSEKRVLPAVSTALLVGSAIGLLELVVLTVGSGPVLGIMGVSRDSNMRGPAEQYLALRAIGAPANVVSLAVQGVFRGFKDTKTPLYATVSGNVINIILVPILMFSLGYGVSGAAIATVISQYLMALILLFKMSKKVVLLPPNLGDLDFSRFIKNGGLLLARSTAVMLSMTLATSQAARQGVIPMAAHQICMQVWLATSLLSDSIALAGQAIIASALAKGDYHLAKDAALRTLQMGCAFGFMLSILLGVGLSTFSKVFTSDPQVLEFLGLGIPFVAATQPINSVAFIFDGLLFGALDFMYAAQSMILVAILTSAFMLVAAPSWGFVGIWVGLTLLMTLRMFAGFLRIGTASGPWRFLK